MIDDDDSIDDGVNVLIDFTRTVSVVRIIGNSIMPARLTIKAQVLPTDNASDDDFDVTFAKIKFWFETMLVRSLIFSHDNTLANTLYIDDDKKPRVMNYLMITPNEPTDEHLGALFQAKMTALSGGTMDFGIVRVNSESGSGLVWSYVGDWREDLPAMADWFPQQPYYFSEPWWMRDDGSMLDIIGKDVTDVSTPPAWALKPDFIENAIRQPPTEATEPPTVIRGTFRPKVIDGDSDE